MKENTEEIKKILKDLGIKTLHASKMVKLSHSAFRNYLANGLFKDEYLERLKTYLKEYTDKF